MGSNGKTRLLWPGDGRLEKRERGSRKGEREERRGEEGRGGELQAKGRSSSGDINKHRDTKERLDVSGEKKSMIQKKELYYHE